MGGKMRLYRRLLVVPCLAMGGGGAGLSRPGRSLDKEAKAPATRTCEGGGGSCTQAAWLYLAQHSEHTATHQAGVAVCALCGGWGWVTGGGTAHPRLGNILDGAARLPRKRLCMLVAHPPLRIATHQPVSSLTATTLMTVQRRATDQAG